MDHVVIDFHTRGQSFVNSNVFYSWFPSQRWRHPHNLVDGSELAEDLYTRIHARYNINRDRTRTTLRRFFDFLGEPAAGFTGETRLRVAGALENFLNEDFNFGRWPDRFSSSRKSFIILAYLANEWDSILLAGALRVFWSDCERAVEMHDPVHFHEWRQARRQVPGDWLQNGRVHGLDEFMRGRSPRARLSQAPSPRGLSLPSPKTRPDPGLQLAALGYPNLHYPSSMVVGYPAASSFDDIDQLKWQQHAVNNKLDTMDQKLDFMLWYK